MTRRLCIVVILLLSACGASDPPTTDNSASAPAGAGTHAQYGILTASVPSAWVDKPVTSNMRKANYTLPKAGSDQEDAELVVYYFGPGEGGTVQRNLERWAGQFVQPDGGSSLERMTSTTSEIAGLPLTIADVSGTYLASVNPQMMMGPKTEKPHYRMLAAIVETSQGPYFFKLTGPEGTVSHWQPAFETYLQSMRAE